MFDSYSMEGKVFFLHLSDIILSDESLNSDLSEFGIPGEFNDLNEFRDLLLKDVIVSIMTGKFEEDMLLLQALGIVLSESHSNLQKIIPLEYIDYLVRLKTKLVGKSLGHIIDNLSFFDKAPPPDIHGLWL